MTDKLLPCPFCGGMPKLRMHRSSEDSMECYVECPSCEVRTTYYEDAYAPTADAIAAWNRRAPPPETNAQVRSLVWVDRPPGVYDKSSYAESVFGRYEAFSFKTIGPKTTTVHTGWCGPHMRDTHVGSFEEAKTAAEEHYRKRILSALSPATEDSQ